MTSYARLKYPVGKDIVERVAWTFVQAAGGVALAQGVGLVDIINMDTWKAAGVAGLSAVLALAKTLFAAAANKKSGGSTAPGVELQPLDEGERL